MVVYAPGTTVLRSVRQGIEKCSCSIFQPFPVFRKTIVDLPWIACFIFPSTVNAIDLCDVAHATLPSLKIFQSENLP
jgi:hypothetical protein